VFLLGIIFILPQCFISSHEQMAPLYSLVLAIPMLLFGGGLEEAGWRHILQPEFEKKFIFFRSCHFCRHHLRKKQAAHGYACYTMHSEMRWWVYSHSPIILISCIWVKTGSKDKAACAS